MSDFGVEAAEQERLAVVAAMCQPCSIARHGDCTGCPCRGTYHDIMKPWQMKSSADWSDQEKRDHEHDTGDDLRKYDDREDQREREQEETSVPYEIGG